MPNQKNAHGTTFHQAVVLSIIAKHGPLTSADVATHYIELTTIDVAYNYQYIITRRMANKGLIKHNGGKKAGIFKWTITPRGKKLLDESRRLCTVIL
ncbi:MAG: hypothetical protein WD768_14840 [Phycisphaeraceae bacterium]